MARGSRKRAVQLTEEGLAALRNAALKCWANEFSGQKLTRELRAELLGLSVATAERVWSGLPVDRTTLITAFAQLKIPWDDSLCEFPEARTGPGPAREEADSLEEIKGTVPTAAPRRRWSLKQTIVLVGCGLAASLVLVVRQKAAVQPKVDWHVPFCRDLENGSKNFHEARYAEAEPQLVRAASLAKEHHAAGELASATRMLGDLAAAKGDLQKARSCYLESLQVRYFLEQKDCQTALLQALGSLDIDLGRFQEARSELMKSLKGYQDLKQPVGVAIVCNDLGTLNYRLNRIDEASEWLTRAKAAAHGQEKPDLETVIRAQIALVSAKKGDVAVAQRELLDCLGYWERHGHARWVSTTKNQLAQISPTNLSQLN